MRSRRDTLVRHISGMLKEPDARMLRSKTGLCGRSYEPRLSRRRLYSRSSHSCQVFSVTNVLTRGSLARSQGHRLRRPAVVLQSRRVRLFRLTRADA
jgi:hypothetical protein